ncbi:hypothetical protein ABZU76_09610 [Amycolatopsis sp. NPDC005232]|uniref:hypothetical protein n=1 Tax=Amycolatopsis sp. NPDC005232 TaxID=3157027 RepID=UPI0033A9A0F8
MRFEGLAARACVLPAAHRLDELHARLEGELGVGPSPRLPQLRSCIQADESGTPDRWPSAVS